MKRYAVIRWVAGVALTVFAFYSAGLLNEGGWTALQLAVSKANLSFLAASLLFIPLMDILNTVKWKSLVSARRIPIGFWRLFSFYVVGRFYNLILPSSIGGDVVRVYLLGRFSGRTADAAAIVFVERFTGVIVLIGLTGLAVLFASVGFSTSTLVATLIFAAFSLTVLLWLIASEKPLHFAENYLDNNRFFTAIAGKLRKFRVAVKQFRHETLALNMAIFNSILFYAAAVLNVWVATLVFDQSVPFLSMVIAVPIIMFIMNIPISIGNIGVMEFGYTLTLMQFGMSGEDAIATALLMRSKLLLAGCVGGIYYAFQADNREIKRGLIVDNKEAQGAAGIEEP